MLGPALDGAVPPGRVRSLVAGWWWRPVTVAGTVIPDAAIDLMWSPRAGVWLAGPDTGPRSTGLTAGDRVLGLRLRPGVAAVVLHDDVDRATDRTVALGELRPRPEIEQLHEALDAAPSMAVAAARLASSLVTWTPPDWGPDALVVRSMDDLWAGRPIDHRGIGPRQFRRRFTRTVGYGPTLYRRIGRLDRFEDLRGAHPGRPIARLAAEAGYFDEAHLWRDCRALAGTTPARLGR